MLASVENYALLDARHAEFFHFLTRAKNTFIDVFYSGMLWERLAWKGK